MNLKSNPQEVAQSSPPILRRTDEWLLTGDYPAECPNDILEQLQKLVSSLNERATLTPRDQIHRLRANCQRAQIYDYYNDNVGAKRTLSKDGEEIEKALHEDRLSQSLPLREQQLWLLTFYSHCFYRDDEIRRTKKLLKDVNREVEKSFPLSNKTAEHCWGLRARIAYSLAQADRQLGTNVRDCRREFLAAIEFTRKRLSEALEKHKTDSDFRMIREFEQKCANYVIGKAFSFGLVWCSMNSGEVQRARGSAAAGSVLLGGTNDLIHSAYAQMIYAQVLRSRAKPVLPGTKILPDELDDALRILTPLVDPDKSDLRIVPRLLYRAKYELVAALQAAGRYPDAEELARKIYEGGAGKRWHVHAGIYLARLLMARGDKDASAKAEALQISQALLRVPKIYDGSPLLHADVLICRADLLLQAREGTFDDIHRALLEAETLALDSPLTVSQCHLFRAQCYCRQKNLDAAWRELAEWDSMESRIEHGWVRDLAQRVKAEVQCGDTRFIAQEKHLADRAGKFGELERDLRRWALEMLYAKFGKDYLKDENTRSYLGLGHGAVRLWKEDLKWVPPK